MKATNERVQRRALLGMTVEELKDLLGSRTRAIAALKWLYAARPLPEELPSAIPGVGGGSLELLRAHCDLPPARVVERRASSDGTIKYVVASGGVSVETVLIPARSRSTVCVSSQAGCTRNCAFCATATLGFGRHLTAAEMMVQYWLARAEAPTNAPATNVVFMGMGEPMDNLDQVLKAVELLTQSPVPQLGATQVTVSTSGVLPGMRRFLKESRASLALSLNASSDQQRNALMPHNRSWPIEALVGALREDRVNHPRRVHFIEYVMLDGVNDSDQDAERVVQLLEGVNARLNLIPHNPFEGNPFQPSNKEQVLSFQARVLAGGIRCMVRWPRGREIGAACGQLALRTAKPIQGNGSEPLT